MSKRFPTATRRSFLKAAGVAALALPLRSQSRPPNVVFILADDLGYGDLSCYGSPITTPNLDQLAREGMRFTQFYAGNAVCSPSRAALMTGRYPVRAGVPSVVDAGDSGGLSLSETTIAQMMKGAGYATMHVGKWHLGATAAYLPTSRGFDEYFGIPYSHDMWPRSLMHNTDVVEQPATLTTLSQRYVAAATDFICRSKNQPFFLYFAHNWPHLPLSPSPAFAGQSGEGRYGDSVQELDWTVGQILQSLKDNGLDSNTIVMFSSDNGPWYQGNPGPFRGRKGDSYEGGLRVPFIARAPGRIPSGQVSSAFTAMIDIMPTVANLTGASLPSAPMDGVDFSSVLTGQQSDVGRDVFLYFADANLQCARLGSWKLHMTRYNTPPFTPDPPAGRKNLPLPNPELYNLATDPSESYDRAERNPDVVKAIQARVAAILPTLPGYVQDAWNATMKTPVQNTPADALPVAE